MKKMAKMAWSLMLLLLVTVVVGQTPPNLKPPSITYPMKETSQYRREGERFILACKATAEPMDPTYSWWKLGTGGTMDKVKPSESITLDATTGDLTFVKFQDSTYSESDEGRYMCQASILYGNPQKQAATFAPVQEVLMRSLKPFKQVPELITEGTEYEYKALLCSGRGNSKGYNPLSWYNQALVKDDPDTQIQIESDPRLFLDKTGTLHFTYLKNEDATSTKGKYQCSEGDESAIYKGGEISLNVIPVASAVASKPQLSYKSPKQFVKQFTDAQFECVFRGYDPANINNHLPIIDWLDQSHQPITEDERHKISADGRILTLLKVTETDTGTFHCKAHNNAGETQMQPLDLQVVSKPVWDSKETKPMDATLPERRDHTVKCEASSLRGDSPPLSPLWYIDGERFKPENFPARKFSMSAGGRDLTVVDLNKDTDVMCIQCMVENDQGQTWGDGCLTVIEPIVATVLPALTQQVEHGDMVNLTVMVTTDPMYTDKLQYEWTFGNKTTQGAPNEFTIYNATSHEAYINTSALSQDEYNKIGGLYSRRVYHQFDELVVTIDVQITDPKPVAVIQSAGFDMWILGLIVGILFLIVVIIIIVFIICRKQQEGDYNVDKKETGAGLDPEKELKSKHFDDYSRPEDYDDYGTYSDHKPRGEMEYDDVPIGGDDESLGEYGGEETYFNEDGSFIGIYDEKKAKKYRHNNGYSNDTAI